ncbi:zinc finger 862-like [Paramuricea clavata]|uniref:Zinc finger 862-like n=1 Tax=Paramuricea clavata TaxID=317549 RepID=A0A6S7HGR8_PARCT|nr:zinc finger 862-like [Paramuricea clavata]
MRSNFGISSSELLWFESYLTNREQQCVANGILSSVGKLKCGVPQGSILGSLLFLLYINDLPQCRQKTTPGLYADDTEIYASSHNVNDPTDNINYGLNIVTQWMENNKLQIHPKKSKCMFIASPYKIKNIPQGIPILINNVIYCLHFDPQPVGSDSVEVKLSFLSVKQVKYGNAGGITDAIEESFNDVEESISSSLTSVGILPYHKKLVGFTSDGASVNRGCNNSIMTRLQEKSPWMVFIWCVAHRLELALSDALKTTEFQDVDDMLLKMYLLYKKAPKKVRQLKELHDLYKETMEFDEGGIKPKKSSGSRWISHKLAAMKMCLDKWGLYIQHLETMTEDETITSKDKAKLKGYLKRWKSSRIPLLLALFIDILTIPSILSLTFQKEKIDPVQTAKALNKARERLAQFEKKAFKKLPNVRNFLSKIKEVDAQFFYQNVELSSFERHKVSVESKKNEYSEKIRQCLTNRLEQEDEGQEILDAVVQILDCEGWKDDNEFAEDAIFAVYDKFEVPLKSGGMSVTVPDLLNQWHEIVDFAVETIGVTGQSYLITWRKIFSAPRSKGWKDALILVELLFTIPVSNAKLERMFSKLKRVKTNFRCSLSLQRLENILRIMEEGPTWEEYDPLPAIELWNSAKQLRPHDEKQKRTYTARKSHKRLSTMSSDESDSETAEKENHESDKEDEDVQEESTEETESQSLFSDSEEEP